MTRWLPILALAAGCTGTAPPDFRGEDMEDYFPWAGNVGYQWQFVNEDVTLTYRMLGEIVNEELIDDTRRFTVEYVKDCIGDDPTCVEGEPIRSMTWSLQGNLGVHLHRVETDAGELVFEPSLRFIDRYMKRADVTTSEAGGNTYTSTLEEFGDCPVLLDWTGCAKIVVTSSGGPDQVTGTYWVINDFAIVGALWDDGGLQTWKLSNHVPLE
ncbi:MAG: hypothetical protein H6737_07775 [Alphaproteobacteria bacterium]|nr:hypothetical protein [Alphaproteobacteria bacterium]